MLIVLIGVVIEWWLFGFMYLVVIGGFMLVVLVVFVFVVIELCMVMLMLLLMLFCCFLFSVVVLFGICVNFMYYGIVFVFVLYL